MRDDIEFMQKLYSQLGGVGPAEQYRIEQQTRYFGCELAVSSASCGELEPGGPLLSGGGYCAAAYLKGEATTLPDGECNDTIIQSALQTRGAKLAS